MAELIQNLNWNSIELIQFKPIAVIGFNFINSLNSVAVWINCSAIEIEFIAYFIHTIYTVIIIIWWLQSGLVFNFNKWIECLQFNLIEIKPGIEKQSHQIYHGMGYAAALASWNSFIRLIIHLLINSPPV